MSVSTLPRPVPFRRRRGAVDSIPHERRMPRAGSVERRSLRRSDRWPRGRGLAVRPAFDDRGIALEALQRRLSDGVEQPHGDSGEPVPARRRVGPLAEGPEHRDGADRLAALPGQVRRGVPSGAGCAGILNPGGLRRLGDVRGGLGETACGRFPPWLPASEAPSSSPVPAEGGGRFQERCRRLAGLRTRIGPIRSLHAPAGLTTCRLCGIKRETRTPGRRSPGAPGSGLAPELRKDSPPAAGGADSGLQGFAGIRDRTGLARAFRAFRPAGIFPAAVSLPFAARAPRLSPKEDVESDSWQFFRLRSQRATAAANGRFAHMDGTLPGIPAGVFAVVLVGCTQPGPPRPTEPPDRTGPTDVAEECLAFVDNDSGTATLANVCSFPVVVDSPGTPSICLDGGKSATIQCQSVLGPRVERRTDCPSPWRSGPSPGAGTSDRTGGPPRANRYAGDPPGNGRRRWQQPVSRRDRGVAPAAASRGRFSSETSCSPSMLTRAGDIGERAAMMRRRPSLASSSPAFSPSARRRGRRCSSRSAGCTPPRPPAPSLSAWANSRGFPAAAFPSSGAFGPDRGSPDVPACGCGDRVAPFVGLRTRSAGSIRSAGAGGSAVEALGPDFAVRPSGSRLQGPGTNSPASSGTSGPSRSIRGSPFPMTPFGRGPSPAAFASPFGPSSMRCRRSAIRISGPGGAARSGPGLPEAAGRRTGTDAPGTGALH